MATGTNRGDRLRVTVIGGGAAGCFSSYYLLKRGHSVTIVDDDNPVKTSFYNAGSINNPPSFTSIGVKKAVSAYLGKRGPVYVSPKQIARHPLWYARTLRASTHFYDGETTRLSELSLDLYNEFFSTERAEVDQLRGALKLYRDREVAEEKARELAGRFVDSAEAMAMGFKGFGGGVFYDNMRVEPRKLCLHLLGRIKEMGGTVVQGREVHLRRSRGNPHLVAIDDEALSADAYVLAAGAWSNKLCAPLGYNPQILPSKGVAMICSTGPVKAFDHPANFEDEGIVAIPYSGPILRISSFFELVGYDPAFSKEREKWLLDSVVSHMARTVELKVMEKGVGYRPCTSDQLPLVGPVPGYNNAFLATGGCRKGLTLAPMMGNMVAAMISGETLDEKLVHKVSPARFAERAPRG
jgi:D-amino-acid dehydrogenase